MAQDYVLLISLILIFHLCKALPVYNSSVIGKSENNSSGSEEIFYDDPVDVHNVTFVPKDLIVIKTVIYEVGILTNADNETNDTPEV